MSLRAKPARRFRHARQHSPLRQLTAVAAVIAVLYLAGLAAIVLLSRPDAAGSPSVTGVRPSRSAATGDGSQTTVRTTIDYPDRGGGTWVVASRDDTVAGRSGLLMRYRVAVETGIGHVDVAAFAAQVTATLADRRSWTGTQRLRLQRVGSREPADFVVYLATPATRDRLCPDGPDRYTSCRSGDRVVLNVARWVHGAAAVGGDLRSYRQYMVNHEVGHRLGHGHERCPGRGRPAPVMQQQTLGLHGCRPQAWPVARGVEYHGPAGSYDDPVPRSASR
jgi:hypothetical protein